MKLQPSPFKKMKRGTKTIEIRLYDEKRRKIKIGDEIKFSLATDPTQTIKAVVVSLKKFPTFKEMFKAYPTEKYGSENQNEWNLMYKYYSLEEEVKYGVLAIQVKF